MEENVYSREIDITGKKMTYILVLLLCKPIIKGKKTEEREKRERKARER